MKPIRKDLWSDRRLSDQTWFPVMLVHIIYVRRAAVDRGAIKARPTSAAECVTRRYNMGYRE